MQCGDGGWGWFSGDGEHSAPHTTALVVHGLQVARFDDAAIPRGMLERGVQWLKGYQADQWRRLNLPKDHRDHKSQADELDALLTGNAIWLKRTQKVGVISAADAIALGVTGPNLRGSGVALMLTEEERSDIAELFPQRSW